MTEARIPYVQAHRGYSELYPENTLLAIGKAFEAGVDQVEIDLGLSADGQVMVIHDATVDRTTDGEGPVSSHSAEQLRGLDAGSWKDQRFAGERIPTLDEVLELLVARSAGRLCIEIKSHGRSPQVVEAIKESLVRKLPEFGVQDRVLVSSFDLAVLLAVRRLEPGLPLMLIDWEPPEAGGLESAIENRLHAWTPKPEFADPTRIRRAAAAGLAVQIDVYDLPKAREWAAAGASGFSSDNPVALIAYLRDHAVFTNLAPTS